MTYSNLLSTDYVFKYEPLIDSNIDVDLVAFHIRKAQDIQVQELIGNSLYIKLMNDIASTGTTTGNYLELLEGYILPFQSAWVVYNLLPYLNYRLTNKSVAEKSSDYSKPTDMKNVQFLREDVRNHAEFLGQRVKEFIFNNQSSFPEYFTLNSTMLSIKPKPNNYFQGIYLDKWSGYRSRGRNHINIWGDTGCCS